MGNIKKHIAKVLKIWRIVLAIFVVQLICSFLAYYFMSTMLDEALGSSINYGKLAAGYDRTVIMDMINNKDLSMTAISSFIALMVVVWCIVATYLNAGSIACIIKEEYQLKYFYKAAGKYMSKFLLLNAVLILMTVFMIVLVVVPLVWYIGDPLVTFDTERPLVWIVIIAICLVTAVFVLFWLFVFRAKVLAVNSDVAVWTALKTSYKTKTIKTTLTSMTVILLFVIEVVIVSQIRSIAAYDVDVSTVGVILSITLGHVMAFVVVFLRLLCFQLLKVANSIVST